MWTTLLQTAAACVVSAWFGLLPHRLMNLQYGLSGVAQQAWREVPGAFPKSCDFQVFDFVLRPNLPRLNELRLNMLHYRWYLSSLSNSFRYDDDFCL